MNYTAAHAEQAALREYPDLELASPPPKAPITGAPEINGQAEPSQSEMRKWAKNRDLT